MPDSPRITPSDHPTPEQVVCAMSMSERRHLLDDLGLPSDIHSAALLVTMIMQTGSFASALAAIGVPDSQTVQKRQAG